MQTNKYILIIDHDHGDTQMENKETYVNCLLF